MSSPDELVERAFHDAHTRFQNVDLPMDGFIARIGEITSQHLPPASTEQAVALFLGSLHLNDLYLAVGCAMNVPESWARFYSDYIEYMQNVAAHMVATSDDAIEFAEAVAVDLFLPDRSGHSRIASYSGRSSLATWLRVLICHRAINEQKKARACAIEDLPEQQDELAVQRVESSLQTHRYAGAIEASLRDACRCLSDRERLVILLRYDRALKVCDIARRLNVHPSNVTRQIDRACGRLRRRVISLLNRKFKLNHDETDECVTYLLANPDCSILSLLNEQLPSEFVIEPPRRSLPL